MSSQQDGQIEVLCPCCGARLRIDATLGIVMSHDKPQKLTKAPELGRAADLLQEQAAQREAHFKKSEEEEKIKAQVLERRFAEALKKTKSEPAAPPPLRDIDLD